METGNTTRIEGTEITTSWELITPDDAELYLEMNVNNRPKRDKHLARMVADMEHDRYKISHQGIAFDTEDNLIDGQHRCFAILRSGKAQMMLVTRGLPTESRNTMDIGAKRSASEFLPGKNKSQKQYAVRAMIAIKDILGSETSIEKLKYVLQMVTNAAIQENWDRWPELDTISPLARHASMRVETATPGALTISSALYPESYEEFLTGLSEMTGLQPGDPRLALIKHRPYRLRLESTYSTAVCIKTARAFQEGRSMTMLKITDKELLFAPARKQSVKPSNLAQEPVTEEPDQNDETADRL